MLYAVISMRRIDGKVRERPRIYPESVAHSPQDAFEALFRHNRACARIAGLSSDLYDKVGELYGRLATYVVEVEIAFGLENALELALKVPEELRAPLEVVIDEKGAEEVRRILPAAARRGAC